MEQQVTKTTVSENKTYNKWSVVNRYKIISDKDLAINANPDVNGRFNDADDEWPLEHICHCIRK